jgi:hypothetical protein
MRRSKAEILSEIAAARGDITRSGGQMLDSWSPRRVVTRSIIEHKAIWIGGAALVGTLIALRFATEKPDKNERDNPAPKAKKEGFSGLLAGPLAGMLRKTVMSHGRQWIQSYLTHYLSNRQPPVESD